ncbi:MAG: hypothetical protein AB7O97_03335 [Planctomycetota bacterium]
MSFHPAARLLPVVFAVTAGLAAQTTGVPGINDYTLNGLTSGSQSCTQLCFPSPVTLTMSVQTVPGAFVVILWTSCPCRGCVAPWPPNACAPAIPLGTLPACSATNQSLDIFFNTGCATVFSTTLVANAAGVASLTVSVPLIAAGTVPCTPLTSLSTQAVVFDLCGVGGPPIGPGPFVLTQAYDVGF